jgi:hypothetical protein
MREAEAYLSSTDACMLDGDFEGIPTKDHPHEGDVVPG